VPITTYFRRFLPGSDPGLNPLLLLHRTGGSESDLIDVAGQIAPGASRLAVRGNVLEDGKARFFRRLAKGHFDLEDLALRTQELAEFLDAARSTYSAQRPIAFGFSNGANIAMSLLLARPEILRAAILLRPMWAYEPTVAQPLGGLPVLVIAGRDDTTVSPERAQRVADFLRGAGAEVSFRWARGAHDLTQDDTDIASGWLRRIAPAD